MFVPLSVIIFVVVIMPWLWGGMMWDSNPVREKRFFSAPTGTGGAPLLPA